MNSLLIVNLATVLNKGW